MSINAILGARIASIESMVHGQVEPSVEELYMEYTAAIEDFDAVYKVSASLEEHVNELVEVEGVVSIVHESGDYDQQTLELHAKTVNSVKEALGDTPIDIAVSTESLTHMSAMAMQISLESKGLMSRAWDAVVALIEKLWEGIKAIGRAINPWHKERQVMSKEGVLLSEKDAAKWADVTKKSEAAAKAHQLKMIELSKIGTLSKESSDSLDKVIAGALEVFPEEKAFTAAIENLPKEEEVAEDDSQVEATGNQVYRYVPNNDAIHDKTKAIGLELLTKVRNDSKEGKGDPTLNQRLANAIAKHTRDTLELERKDARLGMAAKRRSSKNKRSRKDKTQGKKS